MRLRFAVFFGVLAVAAFPFALYLFGEAMEHIVLFYPEWYRHSIAAACAGTVLLLLWWLIDKALTELGR